MFKSKSSLINYIIIIFIIILIDQTSKIFIKLNYPLTLFGDDAIVDYGFFKLLFIENSGMAWGTKINDFIPFISEKTGKLLLTVFRFIAITFIIIWLKKSIYNKEFYLKSISFSLILAGAIGNMIDSIFYGVFFTDSYGQVAEIFPQKGYAPLLFGHVVDMLQFPLITWVWPNWLPWLGGSEYTFFQYVFNFADVSISTGVAILLIFNKKIFK